MLLKVCVAEIVSYHLIGDFFVETGHAPSLLIFLIVNFGTIALYSVFTNRQGFYTQGKNSSVKIQIAPLDI